ncbi:TRAP transporter permease [Roseibium algae]|uniref:TRAP transporter fused permease subunit n=1 Tax=Roseibium algae TaxID=3123038 RepID=A0ABU8TQX1_9HYPH
MTVEKIMTLLGAVVAFTMSAYYLYAGFFGAEVPEINYPLFLLFTFAIIFLGQTNFKNAGWRGVLERAWTVLLLLLSVSSALYLLVNYQAITNRMVMVDPMSFSDTFFGIVMVLCILDACRRTIGMSVVLICAVFLGYSLLGGYLPGGFGHRGFSVERLIEYIYFTNEGIFGAPIAVMASYVFHFVLFGGFLVATGAGEFFTDLATALTGRMRGGTAKSAIVASGLMGMLSGSSAGNVVTTGSFTIPAMKKHGFSARFAAAVEAVASSGGQLTPPIMGAAAFIMAELTGIPYVEIITVAIIPAFLYFLGVFFMVDLEARRLNIQPEANTDPDLWKSLLKRGYLVLPVVVMLYLLIDGWSPTTAAVYSILTLIILTVLFDGEKRFSIHKIIWRAATEAPRVVAPVSLACAVGGILVGIIGLTGLGLRISGLILDITGGYLFLTLLLTMIVGIVLGIGMPTSGAYIILATLLAPGLVGSGVELVAAHMFVLFSAAKSSITPPVAIASYAAAAISGSDPWKTSLTAFKLGLSVFLIPFIFAYNPALLGIGSYAQVGWTTITAMCGIFALSIFCIGWLIVPLKPWHRAIAACATLCFFLTDKITDFVGVAILVALFALALKEKASENQEPLA